MKIDKAIGNLEGALADKWCPWSPELKQSIRLGIEALERLKVGRQSFIPHIVANLPGETK